MSTYTTELRYYCETIIGLQKSVGYDQVDSVVTQAAPLIFENFPIYDEDYRLILEKKILKHYYTREIGAETPGLWKLWLNTRLNEIMPYYNMLYQSAMLKFDPMRDYDLHRQKEGETKYKKDLTQNGQTTGTNDTKGTSSQTQTSNSDSSSKMDSSGEFTSNKDQLYKFSNTPQGDIQGEPIFSNYLTEASNTTDDLTNNETSTSAGTNHATSDGTTDTTDTVTVDSSQNSNFTQKQNDLTNDWYTEHVYGKLGASSYSRLLLEYRETLINIDQLIIDELADLFMTIY